MMRQTDVVIDQAGNIWSINNWKPDVDIDFAVNPGDGIVIFIGLAHRLLPKCTKRRNGPGEFAQRLTTHKLSSRRMVNLQSQY